MGSHVSLVVPQQPLELCHRAHDVVGDAVEAVMALPAAQNLPDGVEIKQFGAAAAGNLVKLLHQIVYATPPPIHTQRKDVPEDLEQIVAMAMLKTPDKRQKSGADFAAASPPMLPAAPPRFSTITGCPHFSPIFCAITRPRMSVVPPGAHGTIMRTGLVG